MTMRSEFISITEVERLNVILQVLDESRPESERKVGRREAASEGDTKCGIRWLCPSSIQSTWHLPWWTW